MEVVGLGQAADAGRRLTVMRAVDKLDRLGPEGVRLLLGPGRRDESGDFTKGAGLDDRAIEMLLAFTAAGEGSVAGTLQNLGRVVEGSARGREGVDDLARSRPWCRRPAAGRIR